MKRATGFLVLLVLSVLLVPSAHSQPYQLHLNLGNQPNDGTGDPLRTTFSKIESNFDTLFNKFSPGPSTNFIVTGAAGPLRSVQWSRNPDGLFGGDSNFTWDTSNQVLWVNGMITWTNENNGAIDVTSFGALGDGVTDNTSALQRALNSGATTIRFPKGVFLSGPLTITNFGIHIQGLSGGQNGYQSQLKAITSNIVQLTVSTGQVLVTDMCFEGEAVHLGGDGTVTNVVLNTDNLDASIQNCTFSDSALGCYAKGRNITFDMCSWVSMGYGVQFDATAAGDMRGYVIQNSRFHGMRFLCINWTAGAGLFHSQIVNNVFDGLNITTIAQGEVDDLLFHGNKIERAVGNILYITNNLAGADTPSQGDAGNVISDNKIYFRATNPWPDAFILQGPNWSIRNNDVFGTPNRPLRLQNASNSKIEGNHFYAAGGNGIELVNVTNVTVSGNLIANWGNYQVTNTHYSAVYAISGISQINVNGNLLVSSTTNLLADGISLQALSPVVENNLITDPSTGIFIGSSCDNALVADNTVIRATNVGLSDSATGIRNHVGNQFLACALNVFGNGSTFAESLNSSYFYPSNGLPGFQFQGSAGINTAPVAGLALSVVSTNAGSGLETTARFKKSDANLGTLTFLNGSTEQRLRAEPSAGVAAQTLSFDLWSGAGYTEVLAANSAQMQSFVSMVSPSFNVASGGGGVTDSNQPPSTLVEYNGGHAQVGIANQANSVLVNDGTHPFFQTGNTNQTFTVACGTTNVTFTCLNGLWTITHSP